MKSNYQWNRKHILIVEDDESSAYLLKEILRDTEVQLYFKQDGLEAIRFVADSPSTDLVLMDIHLPEMDGLTAGVKIKEINPQIILIAQTAYTSASEQERVMQAGFDDFISKPINPYLLLSKINYFFS